MMRAAKSKQPKSKSARKEIQRQRLDKALEEALQETFPASDARRWQDKRFFLTDWYKYALFQILSNHKKLSPGARAYAYAILGLFGTKPMFPTNLTDLARYCGITERTGRNHRRELEAAKLFRFVTPPQWMRKSQAKATEIWFPTAMVTKWLRNHGMLNAKPEWVSRLAVTEPAPAARHGRRGDTDCVALLLIASVPRRPVIV
jgi:hypothetical protein